MTASREQTGHHGEGAEQSEQVERAERAEQSEQVERAERAEQSEHVERAERAWRIAAEVPDPELPMLTLAALGVLHGVEVTPDGTVVARLTPTYAGCPAVAEMRAEVATRLRAAGFADVRVVTVLDPPWTTDRITDEGRRRLTEHGIAPPGPRRTPGPAAGRTWLSLTTASAAQGQVSGQELPLDPDPGQEPPAVACPRCASADTVELSHFAATACTALRRCRTCLEPFPHVKDLP